jgi:PKD repeat protein
MESKQDEPPPRRYKHTLQIIAIILIALIIIFDITFIYFSSREDEENNLRPRAEINPSKTSIYQGEKIILNGSGSNDIDGEIIEYRWDLGNGEYSFLSVVEHYFEDIGYHNITLTVTDNLNKAGTETITIEVKESVIISDIRLEYSYNLKLYLTIENKGPGAIDTHEDHWILETNQGAKYHPDGFAGDRFIQSGFSEEGYLNFNSVFIDGGDLRRLVYDYKNYYLEIDLRMKDGG